MSVFVFLMYRVPEGFCCFVIFYNFSFMTFYGDLCIDLFVAF